MRVITFPVALDPVVEVSVREEKKINPDNGVVFGRGVL